MEKQLSQHYYLTYMSLGIKSGLISTVKISYDDKTIQANKTTRIHFQ